MGLLGRLSNPPAIAETLVTQGSGKIVSPVEDVGTTQIRPSNDHAEVPREEKGRLSNLPQRRLSPTDIDDLISAYQAGATISQLAAENGVIHLDAALE